MLDVSDPGRACWGLRAWSAAAPSRGSGRGTSSSDSLMDMDNRFTAAAHSIPTDASMGLKGGTCTCAC